MSETMTLKRTLDIQQISKLLPHQYPLLLVDRVIDYEPDQSLHAIKNVTMNEPQFMGHFPGEPIMPGVFIVEALAQAAAILVATSFEDLDKPKSVYFMSIVETKFRQKVTPGDVLELFVEKRQNRSNVWKFSGIAKVEGKIVTESIFSAMVAK